jgi:NADP-dependent 3-hydroxy acid dehydrogenase YdfG
LILLNQTQGGIMKLAGKKALITGGNSGIGFATARLFIAEGAQVAITGRDHKTLDEAVAELGPNARGYRADVTIAEDRKQLFSALAKDFGRLDIVLRKCRHLRQDAYGHGRRSHLREHHPRQPQWRFLYRQFGGSSAE